mmetsp:Transcript_27534/g.38011  ORF Transcript_27534/g.38011 Transcript_27534/m.38011 type:complete len:548 (+) Transcript_27534:45-1688(+)|eukprot:CAMPEP_0196571972 /NCGR_PEP_ID=MMETSP1081-20130531/2095_1 /TAXON_ID=36882 /ORGANISM="Pyramimonas amylifera, Strain CCMP720" /LENGTH=547 /DNA_ID=CAMNT_0041889123 /DNA_START=35 /DNA_END=1678 /DNA_ORIENTATION=-
MAMRKPIKGRSKEDDIKIQGHNLGDCQCPQVDIESCWRDDIEEVDVGMQTPAISVGYVACQVRTYEDISVQSDDSIFLQMSSGVTDAVLGPFMLKTTPVMEECLAANARSTAFETSDAMQDPTQNTVELVHTLCMFNHNYIDMNSEELINPHSLVTTSISWNSTGYVVAVAYGRNDVSGWTDAPGALCTWNLGRKEVNPVKPDSLIDVDNPLQCVEFHPVHPALIAGGTFNGEVYVWDLSREENLRGKSKVSDYAHREPVTQVVWQYNAAEASKHSLKENAYMLISMASDGRVLIWNWRQLDNPLYGYELIHPHPRTHKRVIWGATAAAFHSTAALANDQAASSTGAQGTFVVGTDGGTLYRCMFQHTPQMEQDFAKQVADHEKVPFRSPIKAEFTPSSGPIHSVHCSPFQRNVFSSCGIDGVVHIWNTLQAEPVLWLEPASVYLYQVQWSPFRPLVFATSTGDGRIALYDFLNSRLHPAKMIDVCGKAEPVYSIAFNSHLREYLAATAGDSLKVFELGENFTEARGSEQRLLNELADSESSNDAQL